MQNSGISFAQINAAENDDIAARFGVTSFPNVLLFQGLDNVTQYHGAFERTALVVRAPLVSACF